MNVIIYSPAKSTMQSGRARTGDNSPEWVLEYELKTPRHPDELMGWSASGDSLNQVKLRFPNKDDAIEFAVKRGWNYSIINDNKRNIRPRNYVDNFKYIPFDEGDEASA